MAQGCSYSHAPLGWITPGCVAQIPVGICIPWHLLSPREGGAVTWTASDNLPDIGWAKSTMTILNFLSSSEEAVSKVSALKPAWCVLLELHCFGLGFGAKEGVKSPVKTPGLSP